jgi:hypothetical protein
MNVLLAFLRVGKLMLENMMAGIPHIRQQMVERLGVDPQEFETTITSRQI